jgi:hypothetical protein
MEEIYIGEVEVEVLAITQLTVVLPQVEQATEGLVGVGAGLHIQVMVELVEAQL